MGFEDTTRLPFIERPDLSPFIIHLTKRRGEVSAFDNLIAILKTGVLKGSTTSRGYIKGSSAAACFMDVPLGSLKYVLNKSNVAETTLRYEPYGVLISKAWAYDAGARPVLYLSNAEKEELKIPDKELWRVVRFEGVLKTAKGWLHEREWRSRGALRLPKTMIAVLVKTASEARKLQEMMIERPKAFKSKPQSVLPLRVVCQGLPI